jgi:hypothetical protein
MANCECLEKCPFFNDKMANRPATANLMKKQFCQDDFASCARYQVFKAKGREAVPLDLFPAQRDRVQELLRT